MVFFVPLVLTLLTGGRLRTVLDRVLVAAVLLEVFVLAPAWLMFAPRTATCCWSSTNPGVATALDTLQRVLFIAIPVVPRWCSADATGRRRPRAVARSYPGWRERLCLLLFALMLVVQLIGGEKPQLILWVATCSLITVPVAFLAGPAALATGARGGSRTCSGTCARFGPVELQAALGPRAGRPPSCCSRSRHGDGPRRRFGDVQ